MKYKIKKHGQLWYTWHNKMIVPSLKSRFIWRTKISSWSHTLWWKWPRSNNNMREFPWKRFRKNKVFIPEDFYGLKFTTTRATIVSSEGTVSFTLPQDAVTTYMKLNKQLKNRLQPKICCPEVVSVTLDVFPGCTNIVYGRPVVAVSDQPSTSCEECNTTMKVSKCPCIFHCTLTFEDMEMSLNLSLEVLQSYLQQDAIKLCSNENIKSFKGYLLFIEKVDYFYNTKKVITFMQKHWPTLFSSLNFTYNIFLRTYYI